MKPFLAIAPSQYSAMPDRRMLVIDFVWADGHMKAVVVMPDRRIHYLPADDLLLDKMTMDMPIDFFEWPEPVPA